MRLLVFQKSVLVLMVMMALISPFLQIDSLDQFPVNTGDFEIQVICCLCMLGMFLVFAAFIHLVPALMPGDYHPPLQKRAGWQTAWRARSDAAFSPPFAVPLRI
jgi:hypothetical protein